MLLVQLRGENISYMQKELSADKSYKLVVGFFNSIDKELKEENRFSNFKLDMLVDILVSEKSNDMHLNKATFKRARIYTKPDAVKRFLHPANELFCGYDKKGSFINKKGVSEGRCNPKSINYLYVANSTDCCIAEINPSIGSIVSVATIKINQELHILNLSKNYAISNKLGSLVSGIPDSDFTLYLQMLFSRPVSDNSDYLITQYISEKIKNAGFDGLSFHSSKYSKKDSYGIPHPGYNFVIFNYDKCEAVSSKLYRVESIQYGIREQ